MRIRRLAVGVIVGGVVAACAQAEAGETDLDRIDRDLADHDATAVGEVAAGFDALGFALLDELRGDEPREPNVVVSPVSAGAALSLVLAGAGGETAAELAEVMGVDADAPGDGRVGALLLALTKDDDVDLTFANAVWTQPDFPLTDAYRETVTDALGATVDELDLADPDEVVAIDQWADDHTGGLVEEITDMLAVPDPAVVAVLANATHFAGTWTTEFAPDDTREGEFTRDDGSTVAAPLMRAQDMDLAVAIDRDADLMLARLPYGSDERFGFEVLLPTDTTPISDVLDDIDTTRWRELSQQADLEEDLDVVLPRFDVDSELELTEALQRLGVQRAFGDGHDFTPMSPANPWLGKVVQKAVVEVDEAGTEAAAVTAAEMLLSGSAVTEVVVDRSFAFAIRDTDTGANLFIGIIDDPSG